jgi:hypothetical protein
MHRVHTRVARRVRLVRGERGAVFQDRYFSRMCTDDRGYEELLAYVLGNPLRHGVLASMEELERHRWSGLGELLGTAPPRLIDSRSVLERFHADPAVARECVRALVRNKAAVWAASGSGPDEFPDAPETTGGLAMSARTVVDENLRRGLQGVVGIVDPVVGDWNSRTGRRLLLEHEGLGPEALLRAVCTRLGARPEDVRAGRRTAAESSARAIVAWVACDYASFPAADVARLTGVAASSLAEARPRGRDLVERMGWSPDAIVAAARVSAG